MTADFFTTTVFAEGETAATTAQTQTNGTQTQQMTAGGSMVSMLVTMGIVLLLMYFMMIRPQRKREKETQKMQDSLRIGDKIITIGGICGKVAKIKDEFVYLETSMPGVAEKSYIKMERNAIKEVTKKADDKKKAPTPIPEDIEEADDSASEE